MDHRSILRRALASAATLATAVAACVAPAVRAESPAPERGVRASLRFEPNVGQTDARALYAARGAGYGVFLTRDGAVLALDGAAVGLGLAGASPSARVVAEAPLAGTSNYLSGDPARSRTGIPGFGAVRYREIYPGVDAVFYGNEGRLEYDFVVSPGADAGALRLAVSGVDALRLEGPDLVMRAGRHELIQPAPIAYQTGPNGRRAVAAAYRLDGATVSIEVGAYDPRLPLVVDPVLNYSTYLGGNAFDAVTAIAVDRFGNAYVAGETLSTDFPTQFGLGGGSQARDAFVAKLDRTGRELLYSTYLGGSGDDAATGLAIDEAGNVYVTGRTASLNFPAAGGGLVRRGSGNDVFVAKLAPTGSSLVFASVLGGAGDDTARAIAVDASGAVYVTGSTDSSDYPTQIPLQISSGAGNEDAFVTKLNAGGTALVYSTYLGGSDRDVGLGIEVTPTGAAVLAGGTRSTNFPVRRALQNMNAGARDAFVTAIGPTGTELDFSTFLGGTLNDVASAIALGPEGAIHVAGQTFSDDFPTEGESLENAGNGDAFVTRLSPTANDILYSTLFGGAGEDHGTSVDVDSTGSAYVAGFTMSADFPTRLPLQTDPGDGASDAFVVKVNTVGTRIAYSTYFGGTGADRADAIAVDGSGNAYVAGVTASTNLPVQDPIVTDRAEEDGFVVKVGNAFSDLSVTISASPEPVRSGSNLTYTVTATNAGPDAAGNIVVTIQVPAGTTFVAAESTQGTCELPPVGSGGEVSCLVGTLASGATATLTVTVRVTAAQGQTVGATATVTSTATDVVLENDTDSVVSSVIAPVDPPIVTSVSSLVVVGKPYRVKITGSNFQPGVQVYVGADTTPWPKFKVKGTTMITLKGSNLKQVFPKNVPVPIRIVNPDGGEVTVSFTR
jgi:uncharacterized repeat protein (TIGR01451 family)